MSWTKQDLLVRKKGKEGGALGGIRTPDTWFRRPNSFITSLGVWSRLVPFRTRREAQNWPFVTFVPKQSQPSHGQLMVKIGRLW